MVLEMNCKEYCPMGHKIKCSSNMDCRRKRKKIENWTEINKWKWNLMIKMCHRRLVIGLLALLSNKNTIYVQGVHALNVKMIIKHFTHPIFQVAFIYSFIPPISFEHWNLSLISKLFDFGVLKLGSRIYTICFSCSMFNVPFHDSRIQMENEEKEKM